MNYDKETIESYKQFLPRVKDWIIKLVNKYSGGNKKVSDFNFLRLPLYYSKEILNVAKVVVVDKVPMIPLASFGLSQFKDFEKMEAGGITYLDMYFIRSDHAHIEATHFHELVHIIQWQHLEIDKFLLLYGLGLLKYGYENSPLEILAYNMENEFKKNSMSFNVKNKISPKLNEMKEYIEALMTA